SIYDCHTVDMQTPASRHKFWEEIGWYVHEDGESGDYASLDVPLLHKDGSQEYDIQTCFLNPVLMRLYASLIQGPGSTAKLLKVDTREKSSKSDVMEYIHGIDHTKPGAIAAASILAIWGKSSNRCLHPRGDSTNIDYEARFDEYLDILTTGLRKKSPSI
ncbi:hypothetical protein C8R44DRAFT_590395, partial [Mycena epipterygia]